MPGPRSPRALSAARCRLPGWLHAVFTAISHCPRGTAFCLPQCLVAVLFPALDAPVPVLAGGKAVAAPGVATAVRAGPRTAWSRRSRGRGIGLIRRTTSHRSRNPPEVMPVSTITPPAQAPVPTARGYRKGRAARGLALLD